MIKFETIQNNIIDITNESSIFNKKILIVTGQHGNEHTPLKLAIDLIQQIKSNNQLINWDIFSKITIINGVNIEALKQNIRAVESNEYDYNRQYSSKNTIDVTPQYIKSIIPEYDLIIDIHSSQYLVHPIVVIDSDNIYSKSLLDYCDKFGIKYMISSDSNSDTLKQYCLNLNKISPKTKIGFLSSNQKIKLAFTLELNGLSEIKSSNEDLNILTSLINNIKDCYIQSNEQVLESNITLITASNEGIYISNEDFKDGVIGSVYSLTGELLEQIKINCDENNILQLKSSQYVTKNQWVAVVKN